MDKMFPVSAAVVLGLATHLVGSVRLRATLSVVTVFLIRAWSRRPIRNAAPERELHVRSSGNQPLSNHL